VHTVLELSAKIGSRPAGSPEEARARAALEKRLASLGYTVERQRFRFRGWRPSGACSVHVEGEIGELAAVAFPYTDATAPGGSTGTISFEGLWPIIPERLVCPRFALADARGDVAAYILGAPFGAARPLPNPLPLLSTPTVVIDAEAAESIRGLTQSGHDAPEATVVLEGVWEGTLESANLIATAGSPDGQMLLVAHYDCVDGSAGANDNSSGVALLMRLAERLRREPLGHLNPRFLFTGAEEPFLVGARAYGVKLAETGALARIRGCLNFDMVGVGDRFSLRCERESLWSLGASATGALATDDMMASSDHWAFHELGIPSAQLTRVPDPEWHTAGDTPDRFTDAALDEAEAVAISLLRSASDVLVRQSEETIGV
jgi:hypothetical protein